MSNTTISPGATVPDFRPTQAQLFYQASRNAAMVDQDFLFLVDQGMSREELAKCIARRPALWQRFESWLAKLPSRAGAADVYEAAPEGEYPQKHASFGDALASIAGSSTHSTHDVRPWIRTLDGPISGSFLIIGGRAQSARQKSA